MSASIFERHYGVSLATFKSVTDVSDFIEQQSGRKLEVSGQSGNGLVHPEGCVFVAGEKTINEMVDNALRDQEWVTTLLSRI